MAVVVRGEPGLRVLSAADHLAVWGDPIAHSRSPQLHAAAYEVLGMAWSYGRRRVDAAGFASTLAALDRSWRGLSLTFPLKTAAFAAAITTDRHAALTGAVNTLLLTDDGPVGFNTDVGGIVRMLREQALDAADRARLVGAGATATSAIVALGERGIHRVDIIARRPDAAAPLIELGEALGMTVTAAPFSDAARLPPVPLTIATLPGDAPVATDIADALADGGGTLVDVVYGTWPTRLADAWERRGAATHSGLGMLLHQAVLQVRVFVSGDVHAVLPEESVVVAAMRHAVVGD